MRMDVVRHENRLGVPGLAPRGQRPLGRSELAQRLLMGSALFVFVVCAAFLIEAVRPTADVDRRPDLDVVPPTVAIPEVSETEPLTTAANPVTAFHDTVVAWSEGVDTSDLALVIRDSDALFADAPSNAAAASLGLIHRERGEALARAERFADAEPEFERSSELRPDDGVAWFGLGRAVFLQLRCEESLEPLERAVELVPDNSAYRGNLGFALECAGDDESALFHLDAAIALDPQNLGALGGRGLVLNNLGRHDDAVLDLSTVTRRLPDIATHRVELGRALEATGALDAARAEYRRALDLDPDAAEAQSGLDRLGGE